MLLFWFASCALPPLLLKKSHIQIGTAGKNDEQRQGQLDTLPYCLVSSMYRPNYSSSSVACSMIDTQTCALSDDSSLMCILLCCCPLHRRAKEGDTRGTEHA